MPEPEPEPALALEPWPALGPEPVPVPVPEPELELVPGHEPESEHLWRIQLVVDHSLVSLISQEIQSPWLASDVAWFWSLPLLALGLRALHFPPWLTALSTAVAVAGVVVLVAQTGLAAAADIGAAGKLVGTGAAGPVIDMASAGPAAIGTGHAADKTAALVAGLVPAELAVAGKFAALAAGKATVALVLDTEVGPEPVGRETAGLAGTGLAAVLDIAPAAVPIGTAAVAVGTDAAAGAEPQPTWATPSWEFAPDGHASSVGVDTAHVACGLSTAAATTSPWHARAATWLPERSWPLRYAREK